MQVEKAVQFLTLFFPDFELFIQNVKIWTNDLQLAHGEYSPSYKSWDDRTRSIFHDVGYFLKFIIARILVGRIGCQ